MKYIVKALVMVTFFSLIGCGFGDNGELIGVQGRSPWFHPQPFGTVYIPTGTFHTGQSDEDTITFRPVFSCALIGCSRFRLPARE